MVIGKNKLLSAARLAELGKPLGCKSPGLGGLRAEVEAPLGNLLLAAGSLFLTKWNCFIFFNLSGHYLCFSEARMDKLFPHSNSEFIRQQGALAILTRTSKLQPRLFQPGQATASLCTVSRHSGAYQGLECGVWTSLQEAERLAFLSVYRGFSIRYILPPPTHEKSASVSPSAICLSDSTVTNLNKKPNTKIRQICLIF